MNQTPCSECETILQELREAVAEAWISSDKATRDAWVATYRMIGGTEEDAEQAATLVSKAKLRHSPRIMQGIRKMMAHTHRSGHKPIRFRDILTPPEG